MPLWCPVQKPKENNCFCNDLAKNIWKISVLLCPVQQQKENPCVCDARCKKLWKINVFAMSGAINLKQDLRCVILGVLS